ncbi:CPBP family intramembrane glutamic endopeptidase [Chamaesiphon sp.]|uniref:CPBP family intramembrane glutamic endopeptidase n=1 Tax=Chamaesiphon sp. TaxID=2814140 RepID=UPI00359483F0
MNSNPTPDRFSRNRSILALLLVVPLSSIGAISSTVVALGAIGQAIALGCGIGMLILPIGWQLVIDRQPLKWRWSQRDGLLAGTILGGMMFGLILASYWFAGRYWLDIADIRARVSQMGMNVPLMVFGFGTFQTLINSFIEEYGWRWFVYRHCQIIWSKTWAVWISAGLFTLHHIILLAAYCDDWRLVAVGAVAVFIAGGLWARCMQIYQSLLPSYISHLAADLALQMVSWHILLG